MEPEIEKMQQKIDELTKANNDLMAWKQEYNSAKQSLSRLSTRLRKLCKKLTPTNDTVIIMQKLSDEIRDLVKKVDS